MTPSIDQWVSQPSLEKLLAVDGAVGGDQHRDSQLVNKHGKRPEVCGSYLHSILLYPKSKGSLRKTEMKRPERISNYKASVFWTQPDSCTCELTLTVAACKRPTWQVAGTCHVSFIKAFLKHDFHGVD